GQWTFTTQSHVRCRAHQNEQKPPIAGRPLFGGASSLTHRFKEGCFGVILHARACGEKRLSAIPCSRKELREAIPSLAFKDPSQTALERGSSGLRQSLRGNRYPFL
ncbi:hypothetical protein, partial [Sutterella wadsworthensis]|uniref:hypothetical protein n=1 Tax=Sutterella wadsworthensis TaxID=40545 RepID=UPI00396765DF